MALYKKVTASTNDAWRGSLDQITDGEKSFFGEDTVMLLRKVRWIQVDLEHQSELYAILVWHDYSVFGVYRGVVVQVSDDPDFKAGVRTVFNNDFDNLTGVGAGNDYEYAETHMGKLIDTHGVRARYLRFYCVGTYKSRCTEYVEIEAWGLPVSTAPGVTNAPKRQLAPLPIKLPNPPFI